MPPDSFTNESSMSLAGTFHSQSRSHTPRVLITDPPNQVLIQRANLTDIDWLYSTARSAVHSGPQARPPLHRRRETKPTLFVVKSCLAPLPRLSSLTLRELVIQMMVPIARLVNTIALIRSGTWLSQEGLDQTSSLLAHIAALK